jgi:hypothetical protein
LATARDHDEIVTGVRDDIAMAARTLRGGTSGTADPHSYLLGEGDRVDNARANTDHIIK